MQSCPACGAASPAGAAWCGQCYATLAPAAAAVATAPTPSRFGVYAPSAQPSTWPPAPSPVSVGIRPAAPPVSGRMLSRRAFLLTVVAITIGIVAAAVSYALSRDQSIEPASYIRDVTVLYLGVYVVVGLLIVTQITPSVRLRWREGGHTRAIATGLLAGVVPSLVVLALISTASGHLASDQRAVLMMSEGDLPHIVAAILMACAAAPLVEEVLFRGLLLESLRTHGNAAAIWLSAAAFAVWHLNVVALVYYTLMGALFGLLYVRRGLLCSMSAHLGFNGVLSIAAVMIVLGGGGTVSADGLTVHLPRGWSSQSATGFPTIGTNARPSMLLKGPSASSVAVLAIATPVAPDVQRLETLLTSPEYAGRFPGVDVGTIREVSVPAGTVVEIDAVERGEHGTLALLPHAGTTYEFVFRSAGSAKAQADFPHILKDLRIG